MKKIVITTLTAGMILLAACGQKHNIDNVMLSSSQQEMMSSADEGLTSIISKTETKSLLKQYIGNLGNCSYTVSSYQKFHVSTSKTDGSDGEENQMALNGMDEYDVVNTGETKAEQMNGWFHLKSNITHTIQDMESKESNEFFAQQLADGSFAFYGYNAADGTATYSPLSTLGELQSTSILQEFIADDVVIKNGKTVLDKDADVTGYDIEMQVPYETYYKFFCYGLSFQIPDIQNEDKEKYVDVVIHFDKFGNISTIEMSVSDMEEKDYDGTNVKVIEEKIIISFDQEASEFEIPAPVKNIQKQ